MSLPYFPLKSRFSPFLIGLVLALFGATILLGWLLHIRVLVEIPLGQVAVVFNTGLCFLLVGIALIAPVLRSRLSVRLQTVIGVFLIAIGTLTFAEHLLDISVGIDVGFLHTWLNDGNTRLGRMAPNSAVGFLCIGCVLVLMNRVHKKWQAIGVNVMTFAVLAIGLTGLVGYSLAPDQLFGWARSARMAIPTALSMSVSSLALWLSWSGASWYRSRSYFREDEKIGFIGAAILAVVTLTAGLMGFVFLQKNLETSLHNNLQFALQSREVLFNTVLEQAVANAQNVGKRPIFALNVHYLSSPTEQAKAYQLLKQSTTGLLQSGFRAVVITDLRGNELVRAGTFNTAPKISVELDLSLMGKLGWDNDFYLQTTTPIMFDDEVIGKVVAEQVLTHLHDKIFHIQDLGKTGEVAMCLDQGLDLLCFPGGPNLEPYQIKKVSPSGRPIPMSYAVDGHSGVIAAMDYRGRNVIAAYKPLAKKFGLVVKEETIELYAVIRDQLKSAFLALLALISLGIIFLRSQLKPLAVRLIRLESLAIEKELEIRAVVNSVGEGILIMNQDGVIESFNDAAATIFGYAPDEAIGQNIQLLMPPDMREAHRHGMARYLGGGDPHVIGKKGIKLPGLRKDGTTFPLELTVNEIRSGKRRLFVGIIRDITERQLYEEKLSFMAQNDSLTGLPNRSLYLDRLSSALLRCKRSHRGLAVMFLDLDGFKTINDTHGHQAGDELLRQFADRLVYRVRQTDTVSRFGGDEFTILLESLMKPDTDSIAVAQKIVDAMQAPFVLGDRTVTVTTSIGIALYNANHIHLKELLERADAAMYAAKSKGKNCWVIDQC